MRFLIDAQLPPALVEWIRQRGHLADHVGDLLGVDAADDAIWRLARSDKRVIVTKDRDFALWAADRRNGPQIVWIRLGNTTRRRLLTWLDPRWPRIETSLEESIHLIELRP